MNCKSCNASLRPEAKFCTRCGEAQAVIDQSQNKNTTDTAVAGSSSTEPAAIIMRKQKLFWNIQPGEIARCIKEEEFLQYESAQGLIVNDGTTGYIKSNGELIDEIQGGNYDFIPSEQLNKILETRVGNAPSFFKKCGRFLANLIFGNKVKDQIYDADADLKKIKSFDLLFEHTKKNHLFSIILKQNREFQLIFGDAHEQLDEYANYAPMNIRTKYVDILVGVRAFFQIKDFEAFTSFYLSESNTVRTNTLVSHITPVVQAILRECLCDTELTDNRIPEEIRKTIEEKLATNNFHGVVLNSIVEITTDNEDLERFHLLSRELYLSEKELDYLHRTNAFKNRLNAAIDDQSIYDKQHELDLYKRLEEINKDNHLTKDELERFYIVLSRERRIHDAQNEDMVNAALVEIEQTGLLRKEELNILQEQIKERSYKRGFVIKLMQLKDAEEFEKTRLGSTQDIRLIELAHELDIKRKHADYEDERFLKEREQKHLSKQDERDDQEYLLNLANRNRDAQIGHFARMQQINAQIEDQNAERRIKEKQQELDYTLRQQQESEQTERERLRAYENMTAEQIWAQQASNLSDDAQQEYARSFSAGKDAEKEREFREEQTRLMEKQAELQQQMQSESNANMKEMMSKMMDAMTQVSGNIVQNRNEQKEEYRTQLHREQERHDKHQDIALNYTTRPQTTTVIPGQQQATAFQPSNSPAGHAVSKSATTKECPNCHKQYAATDRFCGNCRCEL